MREFVERGLDRGHPARDHASRDRAALEQRGRTLVTLRHDRRVTARPARLAVSNFSSRMPRAESYVTYTVTFWGTRGSIPTPGAHTARYGGQHARASPSPGAATSW